MRAVQRARGRSVLVLIEMRSKSMEELGRSGRGGSSYSIDETSTQGCRFRDVDLGVVDRRKSRESSSLTGRELGLGSGSWARVGEDVYPTWDVCLR